MMHAQQSRPTSGSLARWFKGVLTLPLTPIGAAQHTVATLGNMALTEAQALALVIAGMLLATLGLTPGPDRSVGGGRRATSPTSPVVLVHGFGMSQASWSALAQELGARGVVFATLNYPPLRTSVEQIAYQLVDTVRQVLDDTGADKVHLVGHSLGGLIIAQALTDEYLAGRVDAVVTIASPFGGSPWARLVPIGTLLQALRTGSPLLRRLATAPAPPGVRWLCVASTLDVIVPTASSTPSHELVRRVTIHRAGHAGILQDPQVIKHILATVIDGDGLRAA